jgi:GH35 family endo-1,4-beta-xylanase
MKRLGITISLALCVITAPLPADGKKQADASIESFRGEAKFDIQEVFQAGRLPNVVVTLKGTVILVHGAYDGKNKQWWDKGVQIRRSRDAGKTWGQPITVANPGWNAGGAIVDETNGDILVFVEQFYWPKPPHAQTVHRSSDDGKTWKTSKLVVKADAKGRAPSMHMAEHGIQLRRGKHAGRLIRPARYFGPGGDLRANHLKMFNTAIYSDDGGKTWTTSAPFPAMGTGEGAIAELSDGRLYYNSRRHADPAGSKFNPALRWAAWSNDGGATWKDPEICKALPDGARGSIGSGSGCMGGLVRLPVKGRDILLYSNCDSNDAARKNVTVWASFDGAKTWPIKRRLFNGPSAYSSLNAGRPGTVSEGWIYAQLEGGKKHRYEGSQAARFNLRWVLAGEKTGDGQLPTWLPGTDDPLSDKAVDARIARHRTAEVTLTLRGDDGKPLGGAEVTVEMVRHKFLFGANMFAHEQLGKDELNRKYSERFSGLLNFATLPFYWGMYEHKASPERPTQIKQVTGMAKWCKARGIVTKGHPLCWQEVEPKWLRGKPADEVQKLQLARIQREVKDFKGLIDTWDVLNEVVVMPKFNRKGQVALRDLVRKLGQVELISKCFAEARKTNPKATLLLNDYQLGSSYEKLIKDSLAVGVTIDAIGLQSHMHSRYRGAKWAWDVCERFKKFKKPLHFTELTILSGRLKKDNDWFTKQSDWRSTPEGEKRQAAQVAEFYRLLYSHPSVEAITWWDFSDARAWQGAPAGLVRKDMSPKPAYTALMKLVKRDWWMVRTKFKTDADGKITFRGHLGTYKVRTQNAAAEFDLHKSGKADAAVKAKF